MILYQYGKNQFFIFRLRDIVDLNILQTNWPRAFWPISQKPDFSEVWDLCSNTASNIKFLYGPIQK